MPDILEEEMDISGIDENEYVGGGFEGAAYDVFQDDDEGQAQQKPDDSSKGDEGQQQAAADEGDDKQGQQQADDTAQDQQQGAAQDDQAGQQQATDDEPPEDEAFEQLKALKQQNDQLATSLQMMQAQMQQLMQGGFPQQQQGQMPPQRDISPQGLQQTINDAKDYGISMDDIDKPSEEEWGEDPNKAIAKVMNQVNNKIAAKIKEGVTAEVSQGVMQQIQQQQQLQQAQQQGIRNALELVPDAANDPAVRQTYEQIMSNPANAALRNTPNGSFMAVLAAANLHGLSPVTAKQQAQKQGRQQGAQAERSRQQRLKSGAMHTGGKGGTSTISLSPRQQAVAKQMGITPKQYAEALRAQQGGEQ